MALVAYMFFPIPMITKDTERSEFVRYHVNQSLVLFLANLTFALVYLFAAVTLYYSGDSKWASWLLSFTWILPVTMWGLGIRNVYHKEMKPLPLIGRLKLIK
jgi:uncharacterized membrane protein